MRFHRSVLAALVCLIAAVSIGCGGDSDDSASPANSGEASEKQVRIGFFGLAAANSYTQYMYDAAEEAAEENNATIEFFDGQFDGSTQVKQLQDAMTSGRFDAFAIMPNDQSGIVPAVKQAVADGIKVGALHFVIGADPLSADDQVGGLTVSVVEDPVVGAEVTADGINELCEGIDPCKAVMLWGSKGVTWDRAAKERPLLDKLDSNVKVVAAAEGDFLQEPSERAMADILQSHPDVHVVATASGDQMALGAERALIKAGKTVGTGEGDVAIIGYGATDQAVERVKDGKWHQSFMVVPADMAVTAVETLAEAVRSESTDYSHKYIHELNPIGERVTREALEAHPEFEGQWQG